MLIPTDLAHAQITIDQLTYSEFTSITDSPIIVDFNTFSDGTYFFTGNSPSNRNHQGVIFHGAQYQQTSIAQVGNFDIDEATSTDKVLRMEPGEYIEFPNTLNAESVLVSIIAYAPIEIAVESSRGNSSVSYSIPISFPINSGGQLQYLGFSSLDGIDKITITGIDSSSIVNYVAIQDVRYGTVKQFTVTGNLISECSDIVNPNLNIAIAGATITVLDADGNYVDTIYSATDGSFEWTGYPGEYAFGILATGFGVDSILFSIPTNLNFVDKQLYNLNGCGALSIPPGFVPAPCDDPFRCPVSNSIPFEFVIIPIIVIAISTVVGFYSMNKNRKPKFQQKKN